MLPVDSLPVHETEAFLSCQKFSAFWSDTEGQRHVEIKGEGEKKAGACPWG